ncbi:MAG: hypothetical protein JRJ65_18175 [Deltaproteobacteria bacterium]|nr:hypothetical protein [Deltaproteobacteria bacterium]
METGYSRWREEHKAVLEGLHDKRVFLLFSGGRDSSLTMDFCLRAGEEFGFGFEAHAGAFPVHRYPDRERKRIESYWRRRGVDIVWHNVEATDDDLEGSADPCLSCQRLRKGVLKRILTRLVDEWEDLVIVPGYTLWDIVSYSVEHMLTGVFADPADERRTERDKRFMEIAQRFYPILKMKEGYMVFRPLIKYNQNDILKNIEQEGIPFLSIPCRFRDFRPKRILEKYYEKMGLRFEYNQVFDFARRSFNLPDTSAYTSIKKEEYLLNIF